MFSLCFHTVSLGTGRLWSGGTGIMKCRCFAVFSSIQDIGTTRVLSVSVRYFSGSGIVVARLCLHNIPSTSSISQPLGSWLQRLNEEIRGNRSGAFSRATPLHLSMNHEWRRGVVFLGGWVHSLLCCGRGKGRTGHAFPGALAPCHFRHPSHRTPRSISHVTVTGWYGSHSVR